MNNKITKKEIPFFDHCFDKNRLKKWITQIYYETIFTEDLTILDFVESLKTIGYREATRAGVSIGIDDLRIPQKKIALLKEIEYEVENTSREFAMNRLTALENFQSFIDTWHRTSEMIKMEVVANFEETDTLNPVYMMAFSGARGNLSQVTQLVGMRGFMSDPEGQIIDYPIRSNFREGLTLTEYVISCYGARKGLVDTALRTADAGYLTRRLVDVAHSVVITRFDCKTTQGIWLSAIKENSKTLYPLEKRLVGRVLAENIYFPYIDKETKNKKAIFWSYFEKNQQIDSSRAKLLSSCFKRVLVRSPLRCLKKKRVCQLCYGWTLPHAHLAPIGEAVGILAAQSIGEPGTQLTMRTFHTGGVFSGALSEELKAPYSGRIQYNASVKGALFRASNGQLAFRTNESGVLKIEPLNKEANVTLFQLNFPEASILFLKNFEHVSKGDLLIELPKEQDVGKETVLNTYTYYSKRSGLLKVYKSTLEPYENYDLISHPKLPKIEPFYERAQYINRTFHSFKIYAGQISKKSRVKQILPKPGDLVNTNSLINRTQLLTPLSTKFHILKDESQINPSRLPKLIARKSILNLPVSNITFIKEFGYVSKIANPQFSTHVTLSIPSLKETMKPFDSQMNFSLKELRKVTDGDIFYPMIFSQLNDIQTDCEQGVYVQQMNDFFHSPSTIKEFNWLCKLNRKKALVNQACFYLPEPKYQTFIIKATKTTKSIQTKSQKKQIYGRTLSGYKKIQQPTIFDNPITNIQGSKWISKKESICQQPNLQKTTRTAIAKKDGFLVKQIRNDRENFIFKRKWTKNAPKAYWETQNRYTFKTGWPCLELTQKIKISKHQQFHFFGQSISDILFDSKCVYSEYIYQKNIRSYGLKKLQLKSIILSKTPRKFKILTQNHCILLIRPTQEYSFVRMNTPNQVKTYKKLFYKDQTFEFFKQIQKYSTQGGIKESSLKGLFGQLNKRLKTTNKVSLLTQERSCLKIKTFIRNIFPTPLSVDTVQTVKPTSIYRKTFQRNQNFTQFILKITPNLHFNARSSFFKSNQPFTRKYSYGLTQSLQTQNYFKNGPWDLKSLYTPNLNLNTAKQVNIQANSPLVQSHFLSQHSGEFVYSQAKKENEVHSLILTNKDTCTVISDFRTRKFHIGDQIYYGMEISNGQSVPYAGQIIQITKNYLKLQLIENSLVASNSRFFCQNNQFIQKTSQIFTQSYPRLQMGDIVQGIPKIEEFFEARQTKEGIHFENNLHNRLKKRFRFYRKNCRYPLFIAARKSIYDIQNYIIDSIFKLYNSQGIDISDKHLEIIVRQMTSKVKVTQFWKYGTPFVPFKHPLPTELYSRHYIERYQYRKKNTRMYNVRYEPAVLGITRAALENDGFISAASFQETTRILSRGAIFQKKDYLKGLKENVILGHIIPAGTAVRTYSRRFKPPVMEQVLARQALQVLTINHEWRLGIVNSDQPSTQYFNPIRHNILKLICLEYFHIV